MSKIMIKTGNGAYLSAIPAGPTVYVHQIIKRETPWRKRFFHANWFDA